MSPLKFLVVDDAAFIRDLLKKNLRSHFQGCEVIDAPSAMRAQSLLKTNRIDLILCDWEMPEMSGEEFLQWIRAHPEHQSLPFIMVTSRGERDFIVKAAQAGVSDYLGKPFKPETLVAKVSKALKKAGIGFNEPAILKPATQGIAGASVDVLTGGPRAASKAPSGPDPASASLTALTQGAPSKARVKPRAVARGQAQLNFSSLECQCVIKDISLQMVSGLIKRGDTLPVVLEPVVISIVQNDGSAVARLNGYLHGIQAVENRIDSDVLKVVIRFVDDDPQKLEHLSRYIANL